MRTDRVSFFTRSLLLALAFAGGAATAQAGNWPPDRSVALQDWFSDYAESATRNLDARANLGPRQAFVAAILPHYLATLGPQHARAAPNEGLQRRDPPRAGEDPLLAQLEALCSWAGASPEARAAQCNPQAAADALLRLDPDNAAARLILSHIAEAAGNERDARTHFLAIASTTRYQTAFFILGQAYRELLADVPLAELAEPTASELARELRSGGAPDAVGVADLHLVDYLVGTALPPFMVAQRRCFPGSDPVSEPALFHACRTLYKHMAVEGANLITSMVGDIGLIRLGRCEPEVDTARQRLRRNLWLQAQATQAWARQTEWPLRTRQTYANHLVRRGEHVAMAVFLATQGLATEAPTDWLPEDGALAALVGSECDRAP